MRLNFIPTSRECIRLRAVEDRVPSLNRRSKSPAAYRIAGDIGAVFRRRRTMDLIRRIVAAKISSLFLELLIVAMLVYPVSVRSQARTVSATVDASKTGPPISKYIYGQFLEHGGDIVNTGVWSEMLVDRKFCYPVAASAPTPPPVMANAAGNPRFPPHSY